MMERLRGAGGAAGKGTIRGLVSLLIVAAIVYGGFKLVPARAAAFQLDDEVREQVVLAGSGRRRVGDEEIRNSILRRAEELGLPISGRDVVIRRTESRINVQVDYTVRIDFPFEYHYDWEFESRHEGPVF